MDPKRGRAKFFLAASVAAIALATALPAAPRALAAPQEQSIRPQPSVGSAPVVALPDLQVTIPSRLCSATGREFAVRVKNVGSRDAGGFKVGFTVHRANGSSSTPAVLQYSGLSVGREFDVPIGSWPVPFGDSLAATVDLMPTQTLTTLEQTLANNSATNTAANSGCPLPELRLTAGYYEVGPSQQKVLTARIENIGTRASSVSTLRMTTTFRGTSDVREEQVVMPALAPGAHWSHDLATPCGVAIVHDHLFGRHSSETRIVEADPAGAIFEVDEENNKATLSGTPHGTLLHDDGTVRGWWSCGR
jgi:hypothetical protein